MMLWAGIILLVILTGLAIALFAGWRFSQRVDAKVAQAVPPSGRFVDVAGGRIHFVEKGEGPPIVMIHGLSGTLQNFTYALVKPLAQDHRVIALDRPGCGWSERDSDEHARLPEQARMIAEMLAADNVPPAVIVGHSLGGAVSLMLAQNHPERVAGLALIAPLVVRRDTPPKPFKGHWITFAPLRRLVAETLAAPMAFKTGAAAVAEVFAPDGVPKDFATRGGGMLTLRPRLFYSASADMVASDRDIDEVTARCAEIQAPVGVIYGTADHILDCETNVGAIRAAHPDADIDLVENGGHMPLAVEPARTEALIRRVAQRAFAAPRAAAPDESVVSR